MLIPLLAQLGEGGLARCHHHRHRHHVHLGEEEGLVSAGLKSPPAYLSTADGQLGRPLHLKVVRLNNAFSMWMILWQYRQIHASNGVFHIIILEVYTPLEEISCANFVCLVLFVSFC